MAIEAGLTPNTMSVAGRSAPSIASAVTPTTSDASSTGISEPTR